jgi:N-acetyl-1-D-myo-inositol-2-amino-2-deoxy-alpha-D-glucopyranoside deacetylase
VIYEDSGMSWGPDGRATAAPEAGPDALTSAPAVEALNDLLAAAYRAGAQGIVSYDDGGGYGHPDHVFAHRLARAVAHALEVPFWEIVSTGSLPEAVPLPEPVGGSGSLELHDVEPWLDRKVAALRAHGTQLSVDGDDIVHVGGQREAIGRVEVFRKPAGDAAS